MTVGYVLISVSPGEENNAFQAIKEIENVVDATNQFYERLELNFKQILKKDSSSLVSQAGISSHLIITTFEGTISRYIRSKFKEKPSSYIENIWVLLKISLFK